MAQRRSPSSRGKAATKSFKKAKPKSAKRVRTKSRAASKTVAKKAAPKRAAKKNAKSAKPAAAKSTKTLSRSASVAAKSRRLRPEKSGRAAARSPDFGTGQNRDDEYVYERETPAKMTEVADDTYPAGDLVPGQVGEARPARPDGPRPSRAISGRVRDSETESVTVESGTEIARSAKGGFDEGESSRREADIAGTQNDGGASPSKKQDYGRPRASDGKRGE
jgi:hypothetical protein